MNKYMKALSEYRKLQSGKLTHEEFYDHVIEKCRKDVDNVTNTIDNGIITYLNQKYSALDYNIPYYDLDDIDILINYTDYCMIQREFRTLVNDNSTIFLVFMNMFVCKLLEANNAIEHFHIDSVHFRGIENITVKLKGVIIKGF